MTPTDPHAALLMTLIRTPADDLRHALREIGRESIWDGRALLVETTAVGAPSTVGRHGRWWGRVSLPSGWEHLDPAELARRVVGAVADAEEHCCEGVA